MESDILNETKDTPQSTGMVHFILSHSYTVFLFAVVLGVVLDVFIPMDIFEHYLYQPIGFGMIVLGSILIYWAQSTSRKTNKEMQRENTPRDFERGPYKYSRNPTHIGLSIMTLGLGFLLQSVFSIAFIAVASLVTKFIFLKKEERLLEEKYGQAYLDYKKKVRTWV
jgi:protein-S-isoprenylcysteine O-methyltransferase Ste14